MTNSSDIGLSCDVCGRVVQGITYMNGMKFCAKCYQETFGDTKPCSTVEMMWGDMYLELLKKYRELEQENKTKDERIAELEREVVELKANQIPTRKRLVPKNWDKLNLADKLRYKEKQVHIARIRLQEQQEMIDELDYELNKYKSLYTENEIVVDNQHQKLVDKDKEIEELKDNEQVTKNLYYNYYTQLQNYRKKLYDIDIEQLRKKKLNDEEKEIYIKGFENCERQLSSHIADITINIRHEICEKIRNAIIGTEPNCSKENFDAKLYDFSGKEIFDILEQIERCEE